MATVYVGFSDSTESTVVGYAAGSQSAETWPYQGAIDTSDARWQTYYSSKGTLSQDGLPQPLS